MQTIIKKDLNTDDVGGIHHICDSPYCIFMAKVVGRLFLPTNN